MFFQAPEPPHQWWWLFPGLSLLGGLIGGGLGGFISKRGEIAAIKGKLTDVVHQNELIAQSTAEVNRKVSGRQRLWELRREAAYETVKLTATFNHIFAVVIAGRKAMDIVRNDEVRLRNIRAQLSGEQERFLRGTEDLWRLEGVLSLLFDENITELTRSISSAGSNTMTAALDLSRTDWMQQFGIFVEARKEITGLLQKELNKEN